MEPVNDKGFFFYNNYWEIIENVKAVDKGGAKRLAMAILEYGITGDYEERGDPMVDAYMLSIIPGIDKSIERYRKAVYGGEVAREVTKKGNKAKVLALLGQGLTQKEIGERLGVSDRTVRRYLSED